MTKWNKFDSCDKSTWPSQPGLYAVMVKGDSEYDGGHLVYKFAEYQTFAELKTSDADGVQSFYGYHNEEPDTYYAWYGPIEIPPCDISQSNTGEN